MWAFAGPESRARDWADDAAITHPVLVDEDGSLRADYFIANGDGAFAANPRHYVIDADGRFVYVETTVQPEALEAAIRAALE